MIKSDFLDGISIKGDIPTLLVELEMLLAKFRQGVIEEGFKLSKEDAKTVIMKLAENSFVFEEDDEKGADEVINLLKKGGVSNENLS